jgi:small-conductance mechanosensitive channel
MDTTADRMTSMLRELGGSRAVAALGVGLVSLVLAGPARAQGPTPAALPPNAAAVPPVALPSSAASAAAVEPADLVIANRVVFTFRAEFMGYSAEARAAAARERIEAILKSGESSEVATAPLNNSVVLTMGKKLAFAISPGDVDELAGETLEGVSAAAARRLSQAVAEEEELRQPGRLLRAVTLAVAALAVFLGLLFLLRRLRARFEGWLRSRAEATAGRLVFHGFAPFAGSNAQTVARVVVRVVGWAAVIVVTYVFLTFELRRFPYTRPWGEHLGGFLVSTFGTVFTGILSGIPGIVTAVLILLLARGVVWLVNAFFQGIDEGRIEASAALRETAQPTRRIAVAATWLFALVMAYPYLPGSGSDAFKGMSVFVGLMATLGGSSLFGQAASGLMLMYARSLKVGDYVRVEQHEGTVITMGLLSTKIRTQKDEEISVPNSVLVGTVTKNYSRLAPERGVILYTSVTIGYDTPWRQVHAMLVEAARRTPGLKKEPTPFVWQSALADYYVEYQLNAHLERPNDRLPVMAALHANIQDAFNEYGVQIMSPHFVSNPPDKVWVPRERWHEAPAQQPDQTELPGGPTGGEGVRGA